MKNSVCRRGIGRLRRCRAGQGRMRLGYNRLSGFVTSPCVVRLLSVTTATDVCRSWQCARNSGKVDLCVVASMCSRRRRSSSRPRRSSSAGTFKLSAVLLWSSLRAQKAYTNQSGQRRMGISVCPHSLDTDVVYGEMTEVLTAGTGWARKRHKKST